MDELGQTFVVRLVMHLKYKDGHKTHLPHPRSEGFSLLVGGAPSREGKSPGNEVDDTQTQFL